MGYLMPDSIPLARGMMVRESKMAIVEFFGDDVLKNEAGKVLAGSLVHRALHYVLVGVNQENIKTQKDEKLYAEFYSNLLAQCRGIGFELFDADTVTSLGLKAAANQEPDGELKQVEITILDQVAQRNVKMKVGITVSKRNMK
jgi:hypothetical protein